MRRNAYAVFSFVCSLVRFQNSVLEKVLLPTHRPDLAQDPYFEPTHRGQQLRVVRGRFHLAMQTTFLDSRLYEMWITESRASKAKRFLESDFADQERKSFD